MPNLPQRKHPRLKEYNYSTPGAYFITICTHEHRCLFGEYTNTDLILSAYGCIAEEQLFLLETRYPFLKITHHVIMPNHIHAILELDTSSNPPDKRPTLNDIICAYKSLTTRACKQQKPIDKLFQASYYDHVIRTDADYREIAQYIIDNPAKWFYNKLYIEQDAHDHE